MSLIVECKLIVMSNKLEIIKNKKKTAIQFLVQLEESFRLEILSSSVGIQCLSQNIQIMLWCWHRTLFTNICGNTTRKLNWEPTKRWPQKQYKLWRRGIVILWQKAFRKTWHGFVLRFYLWRVKRFIFRSLPFSR